MKIIIDIPDEEYEDVKKAGGCYYDFGKAIVNGIPLSKIEAEGVIFMESIRETFDSIPDDVKDQIYLCAGLIDNLTNKQKAAAKHILLECCKKKRQIEQDSKPEWSPQIDLRKRSEYFEENDDMDAMLEHLWNDTADEESEDAE